MSVCNLRVMEEREIRFGCAVHEFDSVTGEDLYKRSADVVDVDTQLLVVELNILGFWIHRHSHLHPIDELVTCFDGLKRGAETVSAYSIQLKGLFAHTIHPRSFFAAFHSSLVAFRWIRFIIRW